MDNYFQHCPPMMNDGRLFTDYRSSQIREELFRYKNCVVSENEARTLRIENGEEIMDNEWDRTRQTKSCFPRKNCYHKYPTTQVSSAYNNAEILAYNGIIPAPKCDIDCFDFRMTDTKGGRQPKPNCTRTSEQNQGTQGYPADRYPVKFPKTNILYPERLYDQSTI